VSSILLSLEVAGCRRRRSTWLAGPTLGACASRPDDLAFAPGSLDGAGKGLG